MAKKFSSGFTLTELLIVLAIVAILATLVVSFLPGQIHKGNDAKRKGDIDRIKIAVEEYEKDHNCYPQYVTCGVKEDQPIYPYLNNVPCDPITHVTYLYEISSSSVCPKWFRLYTFLQNQADPIATPNIGPFSAFNYVQSSANAPEIISSGSTPAPTGLGEIIPNSGYFGCFDGSCQSIGWNTSISAPECGPNYQSENCFGLCIKDGQPANPCVPVN